jgi:16S rRNA (guanine527-N7)-methyltransferase
MEHTERELFLEHFPVPQETITKLDRFAAMLTEWNEMINLVGPGTLPHIWMRHFLDSAQLTKHMPKDGGVLIDIGSGAGFPGLVMSILGVPNINLTESIQKKAKFLQAVIDELKLDTVLHTDRVENLRGIKADIITARAVGALHNLLKLSQPVTKPETVYLFLKGQNVQTELTESKKEWIFTHDLTRSLSDDSGSVLMMRDVINRHALKPKRHRR